MIASILEILWRQSWQAAVIAIIVMIVRPLIAPRWREGLWLVVLARLVMPAVPGASLSIFNLPNWFESTAANVQATPVDEAPVAESSRHWIFSTNISPLAPLGGERHAANFSHAVDWTGILAAVWIAGSIAVAMRIAWVNLRFRRRVGESCERAEVELEEILEDCRREIGCGIDWYQRFWSIRNTALRFASRLNGVGYRATVEPRSVSLHVSDAVDSPALFGVIKPGILLPPTAQRLSKEELRLVFLHELAHLRCGDLWIDWVWSALLAIHWFNPILWLARGRFRADREMARDCVVLRIAGVSEANRYGQTLIRLIEQISRSRESAGMLAIVGDKRALRRRVAMIAQYDGRRSIWGLLAVVAVASIGLTGARGQENSTSVPALPISATTQPEARTEIPAAAENESDGNLVTTVYDVRDLVSIAPANENDVQAMAMSVKNKIDLEKQIEEAVEPDSWNDRNAKSAGKMDDFNNELIITQARRVHREVADYLAKLRHQKSIAVSIIVRILDFPNGPPPALAGMLTDKLASSKTAVITRAEENLLLRGIQMGRSGSIVHAPRVTLQNGQSGILRAGTLRQSVNWIQIGSYAPSNSSNSDKRAEVIDGNRIYAKAISIDLDSSTLEIDVATSHLPAQTDPSTQPSAGTLERLAGEIVVPEGKFVLARMTRYFRCAWMENSNQETDWSFPDEKDANEPSPAYCVIQADRIDDSAATRP